MAESRYAHCRSGFEYAADVDSGEIPACREVQLAVKRFYNDLDRDDLYFDYDAAERFMNFAEECPHTKGEWARRGEKLVLEPWQCFKFANVFGFKRKSTKKRKYTEVYGEEPRKNGKSIDAAVVANYMGFLDGEYGAEVHCGATSEKQANEVFIPAKRMMEMDAGLADYLGVEVYAQSIFRPSDNSSIQRVIGNPGDGASPNCGIVDEYHEHKHDNVYKTFQTGMGAREEPLLYVITTAGDNVEGPCHQKREECIQILHGVLTDDHADSTFVLIYTVTIPKIKRGKRKGQDNEEFWKTEAALRMANPNFDVSVSGDWLRMQQAQAIRSLKDQGYFKTKHLNIWVSQTDPFINYEDWKKCGDNNLKIDDFAMYPCKEAVDLSSRIDFTASCKCFYWDEKGKRHYALFPQMWLPEARKSEYDAEWHPYINFTPGDEIDTLEVKRSLKHDLDTYMIEELIFDPYKSAGFEQELDGYGQAEIVKFPQTVPVYTMPMNEYEAAVISQRIHHPNDPVFNWMLTNLHAKRDTNGNCKPRKEDKNKKIDAIVASIMAVGRCMQDDDESFEPTVIVL